MGTGMDDFNNGEDIMRYIEMGDEFGSELDLSEDCASSVASSEIKLGYGDWQDLFAPQQTGVPGMAPFGTQPQMNMQYARAGPSNAPSIPQQTQSHALQAANMPQAVPTGPGNGGANNSFNGFPSAPNSGFASQSLNGDGDDMRVSTETEELMQSLAFGAGDSTQDVPAPATASQTLEELSEEIRSGQLPITVAVEDFPERSRVETQVKCRLRLAMRDGSLLQQQLLHLPVDSIARPRFQLVDGQQTRDEPLCEHTLWLAVDVINPDAPQTQVLMCEKCLARERRRAFRKKTMDPLEETYWNRLEARRIVIINCKEVVPLSVEGTVDLPLRIACYCRHHAAKNGYQLVFTLRDDRDNVMGRVLSTRVFITDSHKDQRKTGGGMAASSMASSSSVSSTDEDMHRAASSTNLSGMQHHPYARPPKQQTGGVSSHLNRQIQMTQAVPSWVAGVQNNEAFGGSPQGNSNSGAAVIRAIPPTGSVRGGQEVTLLGQNFRQGLVAMFGDTPAVSNQYWSESTIIAQVPPATVAGLVSVTFQGEPLSPAVFTYVNDGEDKLKEIALQMIGYKITGKIEDARNIAQRILDNTPTNRIAAKMDTVNEDQQYDEHTVKMPGKLAEHAEQLAMWVLQNINKIVPDRVANINLRNNEGQTMLHLAAMLGYDAVVRALLARGAYVDIQDVGGYTPLHFGVVCGNRIITRLLLLADADPFHRTRNGLCARDVADPTVTDLLPQDQRAWFSEQNRRGSSSSLAAMISSWQETVPEEPLSPHQLSPASTAHLSGQTSAVNASLLPTPENSDDEVVSDPPPYAKLYPTEHKPQEQPVIDIGVSGSEEEDEDYYYDDDDDDEEDPLSMGESWGQDILYDRMLFTFWVPLALASVIGLAGALIIQNYGSTNTHPATTAVVDFLTRWSEIARDRMLPLPKDYGERPQRRVVVGA